VTIANCQSVEQTVNCGLTWKRQNRCPQYWCQSRRVNAFVYGWWTIMLVSQVLRQFARNAYATGSFRCSTLGLPHGKITMASLLALGVELRMMFSSNHLRYISMRSVSLRCSSSVTVLHWFLAKVSRAKQLGGQTDQKYCGVASANGSLWNFFRYSSLKSSKAWQ
jgi:hypothetical protein